MQIILASVTVSNKIHNSMKTTRLKESENALQNAEREKRERERERERERIEKLCWYYNLKTVFLHCYRKHQVLFQVFADY